MGHDLQWGHRYLALNKIGGGISKGDLVVYIGYESSRYDNRERWTFFRTNKNAVFKEFKISCQESIRYAWLNRYPQPASFSQPSNALPEWF